MFCLSHLVHVLACVLSVDPAQAFDFLITGELFRQSLQKFLLDHSVSTVSSKLNDALLLLCYLVAIKLTHALPAHRKLSSALNILKLLFHLSSKSSFPTMTGNNATVSCTYHMG